MANVTLPPTARFFMSIDSALSQGSKYFANDCATAA